MKPSCINFIVCVICEYFESIYSTYSVYTYVYLYLHVTFLKSFRNRFCEARPVDLECRFLTRDSYPFFFFSILLYSLLQVILLIVNYWHSALSEAFCSCSQCPFDRAQLLLFSSSKPGRLWVYVLENLFDFF